MSDQKKIPHTMDAQVWAREFIMYVKANPSIATDEGTMITWFANAIMAGYDNGKSNSLSSINKIDIQKFLELVFHPDNTDSVRVKLEKAVKILESL